MEAEAREIAQVISNLSEDDRKVLMTCANAFKMREQFTKDKEDKENEESN